jgi:hypothetical protein
MVESGRVIKGERLGKRYVAKFSLGRSDPLAVENW